MQISSDCASVPLQSLFNHTASRIIKLQSHLIEQTLIEKEAHYFEAQLICFFGFDGTTGNSQFSQELSLVEQDDALFVSVLILLRLITSEEIIL